jgi:DNA-directed RNA polymerase subunit RPC12/RpoP
LLRNDIEVKGIKIVVIMGYFVCQHCGAHLHDSKVEDLYQWEDKESIGWSYVCPRCKEENYKEIKF